MIPNGADPNQMPPWLSDLLQKALIFGAGYVVAVVFSDKDRGDVIVETGKGSVRKGD